MVFALAGDSTITRFFDIYIAYFDFAGAKLHKKSELHIIYIEKKRFLVNFRALFHLLTYQMEHQNQPKCTRGCGNDSSLIAADEVDETVVVGR